MYTHHKNAAFDSWRHPAYGQALFELKWCQSTVLYANSPKLCSEHTGLERRWWKDRDELRLHKGTMIEKVVALTVRMVDIGD